MNHRALPYLFQEELYSFTTETLVVIPKDWQLYEAEERALLKKILNSVKVDIHAVRVVTLPVVDLEDLHIYSPSRVLIFGSRVNGSVPYQATSAQAFTVMAADDLSELDDQKKKNLWLALRQMFGV